jgi:hypothetical protein
VGTSPEPSDHEIESAIRALLHALAEEVVRLLMARGSLTVADVSPRRRKEEDEKWRDKERASECSGPIPKMENGESLWSEQEAKRLLSITTPKKKPSRS